MLCIKGLLINYRIKNRKKVFIIDLANIIDVIKYCSRGIKTIKCEVCNEYQKLSSFDRHMKNNHREIYNGTMIIKLK